ncbi:MAG: nucleotidyltransferase family protein [Melioribacteraceae bacterium]|nr:nucleotidyltransferase family protein [Melioribacteraceae bacterium]
MCIGSRNYKEELISLLKSNTIVWEIITSAGELKLPGWHVAAGCIAQTVWNYLHGYEFLKNINDIDFIYFDDSDLSLEAEDRIISIVKSFYKNSPVHIDVKNQARVHIWYEEHFGYKIKPYRNIFEAVDTFPTTATCVALADKNGTIDIYAPYGLNDMFNMIVRPNKKQITEEIYNKKTERWKNAWQLLTIIPWND